MTEKDASLYILIDQSENSSSYVRILIFILNFPNDSFPKIEIFI